MVDYCHLNFPIVFHNCCQGRDHFLCNRIFKIRNQLNLVWIIRSRRFWMQSSRMKGMVPGWDLSIWTIGRMIPDFIVLSLFSWLSLHSNLRVVNIEVISEQSSVGFSCPIRASRQFVWTNSKLWATHLFLIKAGVKIF